MGLSFAGRPTRRWSRRTWLRRLVLTLGASLAAASLPAETAADDARWPDEFAAGPIRCHADFSLAPYQGLVREIAELQADLHDLLGVSPAREPIHLYLFARKSTYEAYVRRYFPEAPNRRALFVKARGPGMVFAYLNAEFQIDLRHESTHALLHATLPMMPLWLDEGLAEYFEVARADRPYDNPHLASVRWNVRLGIIPRLENLEALRELNAMGRNEYRNAWAWAHFMLHGDPAAHNELVRFLADIEAHSPPGVLSERLRRRLPDLDRRFSEHFLAWKRP